MALKNYWSKEQRPSTKEEVFRSLSSLNLRMDCMKRILLALFSTSLESLSRLSRVSFKFFLLSLWETRERRWILNLYSWFQMATYSLR